MNTTDTVVALPCEAKEGVEEGVGGPTEGGWSGLAQAQLERNIRLGLELDPAQSM